MLRITGFFKKYLDLCFATKDGMAVRIVERPAISLSAVDCQSLLADLCAVAAASVHQGQLDYGIFAADGEQLRHSVVTVVYDQAKKPVAFNALALMDIELSGRHETVLHLGLVLVDPDFRSKGLSWILYGLTCILLFVRNQMRPVWLSNVSQVPAVVGMVCDTFAKVFPSSRLENTRTFTHVRIAREIMEHHGRVFGVSSDAVFDEEHFVIKNSYTGGSDNLKKTFAAATKHRSEVYNAMCAAALDYDRGDDFLQLGQINTQVVANFLLRQVPRNALFQVAGWFGLLFLNALFLPVVRWLSVSKSYGVLRPRSDHTEDERNTPAQQLTSTTVGPRVNQIHAPGRPVQPSAVIVPPRRQPFDYQTMTTRNIGFITPEEQEMIRQAKVFVCGVGGMGGACLQALVRAGVQGMAIADIDTFEVSNLNRQVFAANSDVGQGKVEVTRRKILDINPNVTIQTYGADWTSQLDQILLEYPLVINGSDDVASTIHLYRKARQHGATVVDAYSAPLPSVTVVRPQDQRPETRLRFGTEHLDWRQLDSKHINQCKFRELLFVFVNSTSANHFHMDYITEILGGKRARPSFAPMVITTGNLMAFEVLRLITRRPNRVNCRGYFFNPWTARVENPHRGLVRHAKEWYAQRRIAKMFIARETA